MMSLKTGNQMKAARALSGLSQKELADIAEVDVGTVRNLEASAGGPLRGRFETVAKIQSALETVGVEFTNGDTPGVRLKGKP